MLAIVLRFSLITAVAVSDATQFPIGELQEYCNMETFKARCPHGDVIAMRSAMFGRMRVGRCLTAETSGLDQLQQISLGCSVDVLSYFDRICSGKSACDVIVPNPDLFSYRPCSAQLIMYLEASYICVTVVDDDRSCSISAVVESPVHLFSSSQNRPRSQDVTHSRCGSTSSPWVVEAQTGQRVNISVLDFEPQQQKDHNNEGSVDQIDLTDCTSHFGYIVDKSAAAINDKNTSICGSSAEIRRESIVYQSKGSTVEIVLSSTQPGIKQHKFLLGFQAVGCTNLVPPADAWLRRTDNEATVGCYTTRQRWHLRCDGGHWKGTFGQCSDTEMIIDSTSRIALAYMLQPENQTFFNAFFTTAVAFTGLAVCLIIVFVGIGCSRRYKRQQQALKTGYHPSPQQTLSSHGHTGDNPGKPSVNTGHQYFVLDRTISAAT